MPACNEIVGHSSAYLDALAACEEVLSSARAAGFPCQLPSLDDQLRTLDMCAARIRESQGRITASVVRTRAFLAKFEEVDV